MASCSGPRRPLKGDPTPPVGKRPTKRKILYYRERLENLEAIPNNLGPLPCRQWAFHFAIYFERFLEQKANHPLRKCLKSSRDLFLLRETPATPKPNPKPKWPSPWSFGQM